MAHPRIRELQDLTIDAKVALMSAFMFGEKSKLSFGGTGAENRLTSKMLMAVMELHIKKFITVTIDPDGRFTLQGTRGNHSQAVARLVNDPFKFVEDNSFAISEPIP